MVSFPAVCKIDIITSGVFRITRFSKIYPPKYGRLLGGYARNNPLIGSKYSDVNIDKNKPCLVMFYAIPNENNTKYLSVFPLILCNISNMYKSAAFVKEEGIVDLYLFTKTYPSLSDKGTSVPLFDIYDNLDYNFIINEMDHIFIEKV